VYLCRSSDQVRRDPSTVTEMHDVSMFLATHNVILTQIKAELACIAGYEDVLCSIIRTCVCWYEQKQYLLPEEKYNIVKVRLNTLCCRLLLNHICLFVHLYYCLSP